MPSFGPGLATRQGRAGQELFDRYREVIERVPAITVVRMNVSELARLPARPSRLRPLQVMPSADWIAEIRKMYFGSVTTLSNRKSVHPSAKMVRS